MTDARPWYEDEPIPYLMWLARGSYGERSRALLAQAGYDDLPQNAGMILAGLVEAKQPLSSIIGGMRASKQAAGQMVDTLVVRGYLDRQVDPDDRRRLIVGLTERGRGAASVIQTAVDQIDAELTERLSGDQLAGLRAGLAALHDIRKAG